MNDLRARLNDAISGERRHWHKVEVAPDDIAAILAATHDHETTWCARCVEHGVVEQVRREDDEPKPESD